LTIQVVGCATVGLLVAEIWFLLKCVTSCFQERQCRCSEKRLVREILGGSFGKDVILQTVRGQTAAVTRSVNVTDWLQVFIYSYCTNSCT